MTTRKGRKSKWGKLKKRSKPTGRVKGKTGDDYFTMAISSPRKSCPECGHRTGGTRFVRVKRKSGRAPMQSW